MRSLQIIYIVILFFISVCHSTNNTWNRRNGSNGEDIWESTSDFIPVQSQSFGAIRIGHEMTAEFDFVFINRTLSDRKYFAENFFRVGHSAAANADDCSGGKSAYPSLWLSDGAGDSGNLTISVSSATGCSLKELNEYRELAFNVNHHIQILINDSAFSIHISGGSKADYTKTFTRTPIRQPIDQIGKEVPIWWMSDRGGTSKKYNVGGGVFSNVVFTSQYFPTSQPTTDPTIEPTQPSDNPSLSPTTEPTVEPTTNPTIEPTVQPTIVPTMEPTSVPTDNPVLLTTETTMIETTAIQDTTTNPSTNPSVNPSVNPTVHPSVNPTVNPTLIPSLNPTDTPSQQTFMTTDESLLIATTENTVDNNLQSAKDDDFITGLPNEILIVMIAALFVCLCGCLVLILIIRWYKQAKKAYEEDDDEEDKNRKSSSDDGEDSHSKQESETKTKTIDIDGTPTTEPKNIKTYPPVATAQVIAKPVAKPKTPATPMTGVNSDGIDEYEDGGEYDHVEYEDGREWNVYDDEYYNSDDTHTRTQGMGKINRKRSTNQKVLSTPRDIEPDANGYYGDEKDAEPEGSGSVDTDTDHDIELAKRHREDDPSGTGSTSVLNGVPVHAHPTDANKSVEFEEGYSWIALTLLQIAPGNGDTYLNKFKEDGWSEDHLFELTRKDLRKLIPDKSVRNQFQKLLNKWKLEQSD